MATYKDIGVRHCINCKLLLGRGCCCEIGVCIKHKDMRFDFENDWHGYLLSLDVENEKLRGRIIEAVKNEINRP